MNASERGRLLAPNLDDRQWKDIVADTRALIPTYAPQWTDHNPSDVGMTLIELFAFLVEGLTYRLRLGWDGGASAEFVLERNDTPLELRPK